MTLRKAWDQFMDFVFTPARKRLEDQWVPVALICLQAKPNPDGGYDADPYKDAAVLWPADVPIAERGPLLKRLAQPYEKGTVLRS